MGNALACPCLENSKDRVLVMRANGRLLQFRRGIQAKEVADAHQGYRVVRCDSDRTVLWGSAVLDSNRLYFLMPEEKARCEETYNTFWTVGVSQHLVSGTGKQYKKETGSVRASSKCTLQSRVSWTPRLTTIPEILSPQSLIMHQEEDYWSSSSLRSHEELLVSSPVLLVS